jgi:hypothetical protein
MLAFLGFFGFLFKLLTVSVVAILGLMWVLRAVRDGDPNRRASFFLVAAMHLWPLLYILFS